MIGMNEAGNDAGAAERFFIDHGMIHDRVTGKHVSTEPIEFDEGQFDTSPVQETCALLNELASLGNLSGHITGEENMSPHIPPARLTNPAEPTSEQLEAGFRVLWGTELSGLGDKPTAFKAVVRAIYLAMTKGGRQCRMNC